MSTIYAVADGEYSDYRICALFSTREFAEQYMELFKRSRWSDLRIEEYELDPCRQYLGQGVKLWFVRMTPTGDTIEVYEENGDFGMESINDLGGTDMWKNWHFYVMARDRDHAVKIANEKRIARIHQEDGRRP